MTEGDGKVVLGWLPSPIAGTTVVQQGFMDSFVKFVTHDSAGPLLFGGYAIANEMYIPSGREKVVSKFLTTPHEWLLFLDWDITYEPEDVYKLIASADPVEKPIIGGVYVTFMGHQPITLRPCFMVQTDVQEYTAADSFRVGEMVEVTSIGMGFTLIHRSVLETMQEAFENDPWHWFGHDIIYDTQDGHAVRCGEDMTFTGRARSLGFKCWANCGVLLGHTKAKTFHPGDMMVEGLSYHQPPQAVGKMLLNIGGASKSIPLPPEYRGCDHLLMDIAPGPDVDINMDARKLRDNEEIPDGTFDVVYLSHVLEHFDNHDLAIVIEGIKRVLKPGGMVDIRTPDLKTVFAKLGSGHDIDDIAYQSGLGPILYRDIIYGYGKEIEASGHDFYAHKTGFTKERLTKILEGFSIINVEEFPAEFELRATALKG